MATRAAAGFGGGGAAGGPRADTVPRPRDDFDPTRFDPTDAALTGPDVSSRSDKRA